MHKEFASLRSSFALLRRTHRKDAARCDALCGPMCPVSLCGKKLLDFFKFDIVSFFRRCSFFIRFPLGLIKVVSLLRVHFFLHFPEAFLYLSGCAIYGNNQLGDKLENNPDQQHIQNNLHHCLNGE